MLCIRLRKQGVDSLGLTIPKTISRMLDLKEGQSFEISVDTESGIMTLTPTKETPK